MITDANALEAGARLEADVCIVGAGAAGITLALALRGAGLRKDSTFRRDLIALALRGAGLRVLVCEGGGLTLEAANQALYEGESVGLGDPGVSFCRYRQLGGTTAQWAGWCRPLEVDDFAVRDWLPLSGWPITRADLDPYYRRAHRTLQLGAFEYDGPTLVARAGHQVLDLGPDIEHFPYQYSPPTRFGEVYRADLEAAADVQVLLNANLTEVTLAESGEAVASLALRTLGGRAFTATAARYVLALGGIENARMLLASNRQVPEGVGNQGDFVGRCFMGHPHHYRRVFFLQSQPPGLEMYFGRTRVPTADEDGEREARVMLGLGPSAAARATHRLPALAGTLRRVALDEAEELTGELPARVVGALLDPTQQLFALDLRAEQRPHRESRVMLSEARDPLGVLRVRLDWQVPREDLVDLTRSLRLLAGRLARPAPGVGPARLWLPLDPEAVFLPKSYDSGCHHMGTTRMAADPSAGVVDADCKVFGLDNLYVAGSSVFSTSGFANPTLTIVALAHRLADHLREAP